VVDVDLGSAKFKANAHRHMLSCGGFDRVPSVMILELCRA
jgi:hypothetical protein